MSRACSRSTPPTASPEVRPGRRPRRARCSPCVDLADGDVVVVTSKVVSKAEGRVRAGTREDALPGETARVVARRGPTTIVRTRHGLTLAAAGIDASNVEPRPRRAAAGGPRRVGPRDPRAGSASGPAATSASSSPTPPAGPGARARPTSRSAPPGCGSLEDYAGRVDAHGNELAVTAPAVADELAGAAELAQGKLGGRPFAVVRGRADLVLPPGDDGPGAAALVRPGRRRPVRLRRPRGRASRALRGDAGGPARRSARPAPADELASRSLTVRSGRRRVRDVDGDGAALVDPRRAAGRGGRRGSRSPTAGSRFGTRRTHRRSPVPTRSLRRLCPRPPHAPDRTPRNPIRGQARQDRPPGRSSTRSARSRRAPSSAAAS